MEGYKKETIAKLIDIQQQLKVNKSQWNSFGKYSYRSAEDILTAVKPLLGKHGMILITSTEVMEIGGRNYVCCDASIIDDQGSKISAQGWAQESIDKKGMSSEQMTGSASSYAKKDALCNLFAIDDTKDTDATNTGVADVSIEEAIMHMDNAKTVNELAGIWSANKQYQADERFKKAKNDNKQRLS